MLKLFYLSYEEFHCMYIVQSATLVEECFINPYWFLFKILF